MRHLRPDHMPRASTAIADVKPAGLPGKYCGGASDDFSEADVDEMLSLLHKLREPFPPEEIEKLPKPMWRGAWDDLKASRCSECGGYHPAQNTIHLDYVGHAGVTRRLLEVDPLWEWEPLSTDERGLPLFDQGGGLWIKLTVCGVTRLGYGDATGKKMSTTAVKEIIGDAIRNAAMRFGVALELWSKIDRHESKNPAATPEAPRQQTKPAGRSARAHNQDALDELTSVCNEYGYDLRYAEERYNRDYGPPPLVRASSEDIRNYAAILIEEQAGDNGPDREQDGSGESQGEESTEAGDNAEPDEPPF